jgi:para-aminobenzoate synthetase component 1
LPQPLFLDSVQAHSELGRYSFITADPFEALCSWGRRVAITGDANPREDVDPLTVVAERLVAWRAEPVPELPPFQGGAAGLFGYGLCHHFERLPRPRLDEFQVPDLALGFYDWVLAFDHLQGRAWIVSTGFPETDQRRRQRRALRRLGKVKRCLAQEENPPSSDPVHLQRNAPALAPCYLVPGTPGLLSNFDRAGYLQAVRRAIDYVHAGDCFQVNLSQRLLFPLRESPLDLYERLRRRNPASFATYFALGDFVLASASPERFLRVHRGQIQTLPIKGTRPRSADPAHDRALAAELLASTKDRSENVMIVDLLRNDLGRVCAYGSVHVPAVCRLETLPFVHHLVSEVRGRLRDRLGPIDLLRASFPGGSVTGAPKIRAMEIIAELEPTARGPYCGSVGYIGFDGSMDTSILIRTFTAGRGWLQFPVGGGIVADSSPEQEYEETWHKARGLLRALER